VEELLPTPSQEPTFDDTKVDCPPDFPGCDSGTDSEPDPGDSGGREGRQRGVENWLSIGVQQDFLAFGSERGVCRGDRPGALSCFRAGDVYRDPRVEGTAGSGGEIDAGIGIATTRLLVGYERKVLSRVTAAVLVGYAIGGGPARPGGASFLPIHAELRGSYWFGLAPLDRRGLRPYATLGAGLAQVDGSMNAQVLDQNPSDPTDVVSSRVKVWKKTGTSFASVGAGVRYPLGEIGSLTAEIRGLVLAPSMGTGVSLLIAYSHGF
jgi:hypothetical protein